MPDSFKISAIVPSYNSARTIWRTIDSLLAQPESYLPEIIVVDSSDDGKTPQLLADCRSERVRVVRLEKKTIPAVGRNIGARAAREAMLAFIDSDAYAADDWAEKIIAAREQGCRIGGGPVLLPPDQRGKPLAHAQHLLQFNEFLETGTRRGKVFVPSVNLFCEKALFDETGGFPEIRASEDVLFGLEAGKRAVVFFDPAVKVYHIFREDFGAYLSNQRMLGKYILIYRRAHFGGWMYAGIVPVLLLPGFVLVKFLRISARVFSAGGEAGAYFLSLPLFLAGLLWWSIGFFQGCFEKRTLSDA